MLIKIALCMLERSRWPNVAKHSPITRIVPPLQLLYGHTVPHFSRSYVQTPCETYLKPMLSGSAFKVYGWRHLNSGRHRVLTIIAAPVPPHPTDDCGHSRTWRKNDYWQSIITFKPWTLNPEPISLGMRRNVLCYALLRAKVKLSYYRTMPKKTGILLEFFTKLKLQ